MTSYKCQPIQTVAEQKENTVSICRSSHTNLLTGSCQTPCFIHNIHREKKTQKSNKHQHKVHNVTYQLNNDLNGHLFILLPSFTNSLRAAPASSLSPPPHHHHHCKHEFSAKSLSKPPPRASIRANTVRVPAAAPPHPRSWTNHATLLRSGL